MKYLLTLSFLGTAYCGWQVQKNAVSVQQAFQDAVYAAFGQRGLVTGCSRTDAGVHARAFRCTLEAEPGKSFTVPPQSFPAAVSAFLPKDISVLAAQEVPEDFHPRYSAVGKEYEYLIYPSFLRDPFLEGRAYRVSLSPDRIDHEKMDRAAAAITGKHDFASFCASGSDAEDTVRTVYSCRVGTAEREDGGKLISIRVCGDGFLYNMVRIISGTLLDVGRGKLDEDAVGEIIEKRDRSAAGMTLPAEGLYLSRVIYDERQLHFPS